MDSEKNRIGWYLLIALAILIAFRILVPFRLVLLILLGAVGFGLGGYFLIRYGINYARRKAYLKTTEGQITAQLEYCTGLLNKNRKEIAEIQNHIQELEQKRDATVDIAPHHLEQTKKILEEFQAELKLRESKTAFFERVIFKLESMLHNHRLSKELESKKEQLRKLKEDTYEELARLEEIKTNIDMDRYYLETIDKLSLEMLESNTVREAEKVRVELEEMTRELDSF